MDDDSHSRLLKFLIAEKEINLKNKMSENGENTTEITSEVPGVQPLRERCDETTDNFVPIMTVTRKEAAYTKGDLKLQKVTVSENVSESTLTELNPLYSEVFGDVISGPQPLRQIERHRYGRQRQNEHEVNEPSSDPKANKTKIPILKFRQTAEKVKNDKTRANERARENIQENVQTQRPRRPSIPKLKKTEGPMTTKSETYPRPATLAPPPPPHPTAASRTDTTKTEEEFDRIFDEIFTREMESEVTLIADEPMILDTSLDDEKVLNSFEEIMHSYDEQKANGNAPVNKKISPITYTKTKVTLERHKSQEASKISRSEVRRNSLKTSSSDKETVNVKAIDFSKIRISDAPNYGAAKNSQSKKEPIGKVSINMSSRNLEGDKVNVIDEKVTVTVDGTVDEHTKNEFLIDASKDLIEILNQADKDNTSFDRNDVNDDETSNKLDEINDEKEIRTKNYEDAVKTEDKSISEDSVEDVYNWSGNVSKLISRMDSYHDTKDRVDASDKQNIIEIPKKTSILSKIAMFERKESLQSVKSKESREVRKVIKNADSVMKENVSRKPKIIEEVLKSIIREDSGDNNIQTYKTTECNNNTRKITNNSDETTKEQVTLHNDSVKYERTELDVMNKATVEPVNEVEFDEKDILIEFKTKPDNEFKQLEENTKESFDETSIESRVKNLKTISDSNEGLKIKRSKSVIDVELGDTVKGKVQHIIETIKSEKVTTNVQKEVINVREWPRKKSVLEKIALFERKVVPIAVEEPPAPSNQRLQRNKDGRQSTETNLDSNELIEMKLAELEGAKLKYGSVMDMPVVELNDGAKMPVLAVGTALLDERLIKHIVGAALDLGYRAVDSAYIYGNERGVGEAVRSKIEDGTVTRKEIYIISKLWSTFHQPQLVEQACRESLANMGLDYFDLYMIHNPMSFKEGGDLFPKIANVLQYSQYDYLDAWFAMESLVGKGLVRSIGLSNFNSQQIARILEKGTIKPVVNQVECHPYLTQERLSEFCDAHNIHLSCYGALGSKGTPAAFKNSGVEAVIDDPLIKVMASALNISPARLLIRYQLSRSHSVVVKASTAAHLWEDLGALDAGLSLTQSQVDALNALNRNKRNFSFKEMGDTHKNYPFKIPF